MLTAAGIGWVCGGLGVLSAAGAAAFGLWGLAEMRTLMCLIALSILFFGVGCLLVAIAESGRRAGLAAQRAFELGVQYARGTAHGQHRDEAA